MAKQIKFLYLTDTHWGFGENGYCIQPRYKADPETVMKRLARWIKAEGIDFVVHGGDIVDHGTPEEIDLAVSLCGELPVPVYLSLGNHDLMEPDSMDLWRSKATALLPEGRDCFHVDIADYASLYVVGHHWLPDRDFYWDKEGDLLPRLSADQIDALDSFMQECNRPVIAVTHAPLNEVPASQRGTDAPFHPPYLPYLETWNDLARRHPNLRLVLTGHNHAHSNHDHGGYVSCTTGAFSETPVQARLVTVSPQEIAVDTVSLAEPLGLPSELSPPNIWCVGPASEHRISLSL